MNYLIKALLERMNISKKILSDSEKEDLALLKLMLQADRSDFVSEKEIFKILRKNGNWQCACHVALAVRDFAY